MRNAWRFLFNGGLPRSYPAVSSNLQVSHLQLPNPRILATSAFQNPIPRCFSSELAVNQKKYQRSAVLASIFSKSIGFDEINDELRPLSFDLDQETVNSVLRSLEDRPDNARRFFDWVLEREAKGKRILLSKSFNLMLGIIGKSKKPEKFWDFYQIVKEKGYGVAKETFLKVSERFENKGMDSDLNLLKESYSVGSPQIVAAKFCNILLKEEGEPEEIHKKLRDSGIGLSSELVVAVLDQISSYPKKALLFF